MAKKKGAFLAYAHSDREIALEIAAVLRKRSVVATIDTGGVAIEDLGTDLFTWIQQALDRSAILIVVWSGRAAKSVWLRRELDYFFAQNGLSAPVIFLRTDDAEMPVLRDLSGSPVQFIATDLTNRSKHARRRVIDSLAQKLYDNYLRKDPKKVFISYSHADDGMVSEYIAQMQACGFRPTRDKNFVVDDEDFAAPIVDEIEDSAMLCYVSSANSNRSRQCPRELRIADGYKLPFAWIRLDSAALSRDARYFLAGVPPWQQRGFFQQNICTYLKKRGAS